MTRPRALLRRRRLARCMATKLRSDGGVSSAAACGEFVARADKSCRSRRA
jgi:hypothetical protein